MDLNFLGAFCQKSEKSKIEISRGAKHWLFLRFYKPMTIVLNSKEIETKANAALICSPNNSIVCAGQETAFEYDYFKFELKNENYFDKISLPVNEVFYIRESQLLEEEIKKITWLLAEKTSDNSLQLDECAKNVFEFLERQIFSQGPKTRRQKNLHNKMLNLRKEVKDQPERWTVDSMAESVKLTRCRFSVLYKEIFGAAPSVEKREFLNQKAKDLLCSSDKSVQQIAAECGYNECENFIRAFRNCNGMSPLQFRKSRE